MWEGRGKMREEKKTERLYERNGKLVEKERTGRTKVKRRETK